LQPKATEEPESIFKWQTMREIGPHALPFKDPVHGKTFEVELTTGPTIRKSRPFLISTEEWPGFPRRESGAIRILFPMNSKSPAVFGSALFR